MQQDAYCLATHAEARKRNAACHRHLAPMPRCVRGAEGVVEPAEMRFPHVIRFVRRPQRHRWRHDIGHRRIARPASTPRAKAPSPLLATSRCFQSSTADPRAPLRLIMSASNGEGRLVHLLIEKKGKPCAATGESREDRCVRF